MKQAWKIKELGDVCNIGLGKTPYRANKSFWDISRQTGNVWLSIADLLTTSNNIIYDSKEYITDEAASTSKIVKEGTLLLSFKLTLGRMAFAGKDLFTNEAIASLPIKDAGLLNKYFLYYFFIYFDWDTATESEIKVKGKTLNKAKLQKIKIPIPPLPEQQKIVSILDKTFTAIDQAKQHAEQNLKNAKKLFNSYLQSIFTNKGDDWEEKTLGQLSKINYGYTESASFDNIGPKFLRITDIQENGVKWDTVPYCKCSDADIPKYKLYAGDIVFARTGATTGKSYLIHNPPNAIFASYLIRLKLISISDFVPKFVAYYFNTKTYWNTINSGISGSAQGGFNASKLGELNFPFPTSLNKQQLLVDKLDALSAETQQLETIYQQKLTELDDLKKSILQKAFNGELI